MTPAPVTEWDLALEEKIDAARAQVEAAQESHAFVRAQREMERLLALRTAAMRAHLARQRQRTLLV